jgi:hypothetical protein
MSIKQRLNRLIINYLMVLQQNIDISLIFKNIPKMLPGINGPLKLKHSWFFSPDTSFIFDNLKRSSHLFVTES